MIDLSAITETAQFEARPAQTTAFLLTQETAHQLIRYMWQAHGYGQFMIDYADPYCPILTGWAPAAEQPGEEPPAPVHRPFALHGKQDPRLLAYNFGAWLYVDDEGLLAAMPSDEFRSNYRVPQQ